MGAGRADREGVEPTDRREADGVGLFWLTENRDFCIFNPSQSESLPDSYVLNLRSYPLKF
jgi:hypothetical protein